MVWLSRRVTAASRGSSDPCEAVCGEEAVDGDADDHGNNDAEDCGDGEQRKQQCSLGTARSLVRLTYTGQLAIRPLSP